VGDICARERHPRELSAMLAQEPGTASAANALLALAGGFQVARALHLAAKLGIADLLQDQSKTVDELAAATGTDPSALLRMMRVLVCVGVFGQDQRGAFLMTPLSMHLLTGAAQSLRDLILFHLGPEAYESWAHVEYAVQTGGIAFDHAFGEGVWDYRARHAEYAALFDRAMSDVAEVHANAVLSVYSFSAFRRMVDVGGGNGKLLAKVLAVTPGLRGVLFDLPHVAERARDFITAAGLTNRCEVVHGDMFSQVPQGADAYVLSRVIHDWDDAQAVAILSNCRRAMAPAGRVLLVERVLPATLDHSPALRSLLVSDLTMMVMNGGRERTEAEYRELLSRSGLRLAKVMTTSNGISLLDACAAE
jgi:SAM-dependent methyltransferase